MTEITNEFEYEAALGGERVVIEFMRRHGCVPCQRLAPHMEAVANHSSTGGIDFYKVVLDEIDKKFLILLMDLLKLRGTPTVVEFRAGIRHRDIESRTAPLIIKELTNE